MTRQEGVDFFNLLFECSLALSEDATGHSNNPQLLTNYIKKGKTLIEDFSFLVNGGPNEGVFSFEEEADEPDVEGVIYFYNDKKRKVEIGIALNTSNTVIAIAYTAEQ